MTMSHESTFAVERVEEELPAWPGGLYARRLGDDASRVLDMLEEVHGTHHVEAVVLEGEEESIAGDVRGVARCVV